MRIEKNGHIGIGTNNPNEMLTVEADYGYKGAVRAVNSDSNGRGIFAHASHSSGNNYAIYAVTNSSNGYAGYFQGRTYFKDNVGMGTSNPKAELHVADHIRVGEDASYPTVYGEIKHEGGGTGFIFNARAGGGWADMAFQTDGTTRMFIESQGNVGMGTASPGAGLHVHNDTMITGDLFRVSSGIFPTTNRLIVEGDGSVGINTDNPGSFTLAVNGSAAKPGGGSWSNFSDVRLKKNIDELSNSLDKLLALRGVTFEYKDPTSRLALPGRQIGMIAQDVEKVFPEWVDEDAEGYKYVTVRGLEALVVEALRELKTEKDTEMQTLRTEKDAQITAQQKEITDLHRRLEAIEALLAERSSEQNK
jgi:hypothetical protein